MSDKGKDKLQEAIQKIDLPGFLTSLGIQIQKQSSKKLYCLCPFCGEKQKLGVTPSGEKKGLWKCYRDTCGYSGNLLTLYAQVKGTDNKEAFKAILKEAGLWEDRQSNVVPIRAKQEGKNRAGQEDLPPWSEGQDGAHSGDRHGEGRGTKAQGDGPADPEASADPEKSNEKSNDIDKDAAGGGSGESGGVRPRDIYTRFVELCPLTEKDRKHLTEYRGFSDATIDALKFRSGGRETVPPVIEALRKEFADQELLAAKLLVKVGGGLIINQQLTEDRILIPYLDTDGDVYHLRPHKLGFKDLPPEPYCQFIMDGEEAVLTEGEFKAVALYQWGIPAVAIPGISSFGNKHYDRLVDELKKAGTRKLTIVFDNEIKHDPALPNYKKQPSDRYDTDFWAYLMSYKLFKSGFHVRVGKLPDEWRENGKIDFDRALAMGKTKDEILGMVELAKTHKEYLEDLTEEGRKIVRRKLSRQFTVVPVNREFNKYVARRTKGDATWEEPISNFVIDIKSSFATVDGVIRNVQLVNEYGEKSAIFALSPGDMAGLNEFKKFCFGKGNYIFKGTTQDLLHIWEVEFLRDMGDMIYKPDCIGRVEGDLWLFGNLAIKQGKVYEIDNDNIAWVDGKGWRPDSLQVDARGVAMEDAIPQLYTTPIDLKELARRLKQTVGGYEAYVGLGWVVATIFSEDIFKVYKCMPILFPHGRRESGKSTVMRWFMACFGIETDGYGIAETTQNFIARALSYYSSLGCWFDEYRNVPKVTQKDGFFRSAYNRQLSGKGTPTAFQAKGFGVRAVPGVSGEELPQDNALFTRLVQLQISEYKRDRTYFDELNRGMNKFSYLAYYLITNYDRLKPAVLANIAGLKRVMLSHGVSDRTAENWAMCAGAFEAAILEDDGFIPWVIDQAKEIKKAGEAEHMLNVFWNDVLVLATKKDIGKEHISIMGNELHVWFTGAYGAFAVYYRQKTGREPFDEQSIKKYLSDEPYFKGFDRKYFGQKQKRAAVIDLEQAPETVKEIAEYAVEQ